jgi:trigger factor
VTLDKKAVDETIEALREMRATEKIVLRKAKDGDKAVIDFEILMNGVVIEGGAAKDTPVFLGKGQFLPEIEKNIIGMGAGEERAFTITFPKDYFKRDLAGKEAKAKVKVKGVYEIEKPKVDDAFAKATGNFVSAKELREKIEENIKAEAELKERQRLEMAVLDEIVEHSTFDPFPESMIDAEIHKMIHELQHDITSRGLAWEEYLKHIKKTEEDMHKEFAPNAEKRLKVAIATREIAKAEKIEVTNAEIAAEVEKVKEQYKDHPEQLGQFDTEDFRSYVRAFLMNQKTFEKLTSYVK